MRKPIIILIGIILLATFLRLYRLNDVPPGVNRDEASIGFTAYSLLKTGKDEYGRSFPVSFQSFGDWKLPLYIYETVPMVAVLGMTELAVRLPSAAAGIITVALTYFLVMELTRNLKVKREPLALLCALILAIEPWHLHVSRVESESNTAVMLITLGLILLLRSLRKNNWLFVVASALIGLTYFTYAGNHIFTTLFVAGLLVIYRKELLRLPTFTYGAAIFGLLFIIIVSQTLIGADRTKISGISIFGDPTVIHTQIELPRDEHTNPNGIIPRFIHNRVTYAITTVWDNYMNAFSPKFLFISGAGNHAHNIQGFGNMYPIEAIFLLLGVVTLIVLRNNSSAQLLLYWLAISPVAASITKDAPHSNRMFAVFPALSIFVAIGIYALIANLKNKWLQKTATIFIIFSYVFYMGIYFERYYYHFPRNETAYWGNGYKRLTEILDSPQYKDKQVIMSHPEYSPYIYLLFYSGFDPATYQREALRYAPTPDAFVHVKSYDRFTFRAIDWQKDSARHNTVLVDVPQDIPGAYKTSSTYQTIVLPDGTPFWGIVSLP